MLRVFRSLSILSLGLSLGLAGGCRQATSPDGKRPKSDKQGRAAKVQLPDPLVIPDNPTAVSWIAQPGRAIAMLEPYSPAPLNVAGLAQMALEQLTEPALAEQIAAAISVEQPFANLVLDGGEEVYRVSLLEPGRAQLLERFATLEPVGEFGGVRLPANANVPSDRTWLAWIDQEDGGVLVLANSEAGLVTGRSLAAAYAKQPVFFSLDLTQLSVPADVPVAKVRGSGTLDEVSIEVELLPGQDPLAQIPIATGTLAGLLEGQDMVAGATTRYSEYDERVRELTSMINAEVRNLPFLIRGLAEDLAASLNTLVRTWDGRSLVALGPNGHVRAAYGATNVNKSRVAMIHLLQKIVDNVSLIRNFTDEVPKMNMRRRVDKADGVDIELFVISNAQARLPSELRALVDGDGRLNVAMAWSERAGGGMFVVGPQASAELKKWLESTVDAPSHTETAEQLAAASFAGNPQQLVELLTTVSQDNLDLARILAFEANGPRWQVNLIPEGQDRYRIDLRTPGAPKPERVKAN